MQYKSYFIIPILVALTCIPWHMTHGTKYLGLHIESIYALFVDTVCVF